MEATIVGTVDPMGYLYCAACRPARTAVSDGCEPVYSDAAPHNTEECEGCRKPLVAPRVKMQPLYVRTRTGVKVHRGGTGSSMTNCGVWLRTNGQNMAVAERHIQAGHLCESCFGPEFIAAFGVAVQS